MTSSVHISLVTHGHGDTVIEALHSIASSVRSGAGPECVWLTFNLDEPDLLSKVQAIQWPFALKTIHNTTPLGFGANHNQAFAYATDHGDPDWFVVMNPDIFWPVDGAQFWLSLQNDAWPSDVGLVCPVQVDASGQRQDFARRLMTPWGLGWRVLRRVLNLSPSGVARSVDQADWVNGACMVWRSAAYRSLKGFDPRYFMYCEDTDVCLRAQLAGWKIQGAEFTVTHDAQRQTGRNWRHLRWHAVSMLNLWFSRAFWWYMWRGHMPKT